MLAKQSVCKTQMESGQEVRVEVKLRKGGNKKKEWKKVGEEIVRDLTIAETRGRKQTASTKLLGKNSNDCLHSWQKVSRTGPNKAAQISHGHGYDPEIESSRDGCERLGRSLVKYPVQFVAETAPAMGGESTALVINNSALDLTNCNGYRHRKGNGKKSKVAITTNLNTRRSRSKMLGGVSYEPDRGVHVSSGRMGKSVDDAETESSAVLESHMSSDISVPDSAITTDVLERKEKEGELGTRPDNQELRESPQQTVQSRGHPYCTGRKRKIELQSVGNSESLAVQEKTQQILHSELTQESQGNESSGKDIGRIGRVKWGRKTMSVKEAQKMGRHQNTDKVHKVEKGDEGTLSYRELAPEQVSVHDGDLKQACEISTASVKGEEEYDAHFAVVLSNTISRSPDSLGLCQRDDIEPSNLLTRSDVVCNIQSDICSLDLMETSTQESIQVSCSFTKTKETQNNDISKESEGDSNLSSSSNVLSNSAITNTKDMSDPCAEHCGKSLENVLVEDCKLEMMEGGSRDMPVEPWKLNSSTEKDLRVQKGRKHKQRRSRVAGTHKRKERQSQGARDDAIEIKEPQKKDNALKIKSSTAQMQPRLKRRHSCPEIAPADSSLTGFMVPSSPLSRFPRSLVFHIPRSRPSSVKRARRHTVCSLEVEREIAPMFAEGSVSDWAGRALWKSFPCLPRIALLHFSPRLRFSGKSPGLPFQETARRHWQCLQKW
ncbi:hypothetical protein AGOR_G00094190 [Albula goreensis]|uniref:Uncharacterized protein n=1 Tax=Albula goreensis TaxID=1534307 RepID=A0A8T3DK15_9TELE|nr:hypothetical protein AGOR_G00094190 [Albula goreensis]